MLNSVFLFQELSKDDKIDFFIKCQDLLLEYHPSSEFLFTKENLEERKSFVMDFYKNYKGYCFKSDNICILFNKIIVEDPNKSVETIKKNIFQPPKDNYNAIIVDFVVFRKLTDCIDFCKEQYSPNIKYILFVKNSEVKIYETDKLLQKLKSVN